MHALRRTAFALALLPLAPAWAADPAPDTTPAAASAIELQIRTWLAGLVGPTIRLGDRPVQVTPDGDHFGIAIPAGRASSGALAPMLTAAARQIEGGKWAIEQVRVPSPIQFTIDLPTPPKNGETTPGSLQPVLYTLRADQSSGQGLFDPTYGTPSTFSVNWQGMDLQAAGASLQQSSHVDRATTLSTLRPTASGRVDVLTESTFEGYTLVSKMAETPALRLEMQRARISGELTAVSRDRAAEVVQALIQVSNQAAAGAPKTPVKGTSQTAQPTPVTAKSLRILLQALADFASGMTLDETVDRLTVSFGDLTGTAEQFRFGLGARSEQGILQARMDMGVDGLKLPELGLGDMAVLIPSKVALRPFLSGIAMTDLMRLGANSADGKEPSRADIAALFSRGGISTGLESFALDIAGTSFAGSGKVLFASPERFDGQGQITASNFDLLQQQVAAMPALAGAMPVFIVAKGLARTVDNRLIWDIAYADGKLMVNNQDLSAMTGAPPPPAAKTPARPQNRTR